MPELACDTLRPRQPLLWWQLLPLRPPLLWDDITRDLFICQNRPIHTVKQTYSYAKTDLFISCKTDLLPLSPPLLWEDMTKDSLYHKTDLFISQNRPIHAIHTAKQNYSYGKTDLFIWQNRTNYMEKKTCLYGKTDLFIWQNMAKETYLYGKRDLRIWQKRPTYVA